MMSSTQKSLALVGALILVIGGVFFVVTRKPAEVQPNTPNTTQSEPAAPVDQNDPSFLLNQVISTTTMNGMEYETVKNRNCGLTFVIPAEWSAEGYLGESKIVSPEDARQNEEWAAAHQDLIQNEEGDAPLGPDARSLYISCQDGSVNGDLASRAIKTMQIDGVNAYEMASTSSMPDGTPNTSYQIILDGPKVITIYLGQTEYGNLSDAVKQIIGSISFEK